MASTGKNSANQVEQLREQHRQATERGDTAEADRLQQQITQAEQGTQPGTSER